MLLKHSRAAWLLYTVICSYPDVLFGDELKWTHYGVRPLAMGNAYVGVADDFNALFYNPAGLARLPTWSFEVVNPRVAVSANTITTVNKVSGMANNSSEGKSSVESALDTFSDLTGKTQYVSIGLTPHVVFPGFGFGIGIDVGGSLAFHHDVTADLDTGVDVLVPVSYAKSMLDDRLSLGATVKGVMRTGVKREFSLADITAFTKKSGDSTTEDDPKLSDYVQSGKGLGTDIGLLFTPIKVMEPTLGVSVTDIGGTPLQKTSDDYQKPAPREPSVNTGISFKPYTSGNSYLLTSMDVHAINQPLHFSKKVNFGAEYGLGKILKLQTGLHQGELSGGFQLDAWLLVLRFATYAEQLGTTAAREKDLVDRRYVLEMKLLL